ncbi:MAG: hypothetical protein ABID87_07070 [Chloroflexota bacterium]
MTTRIAGSKLRRCPRCRGNLYLDADEHSRFLQCLQCGYAAELTGQVRAGRACRTIAPSDSYGENTAA